MISNFNDKIYKYWCFTGHKYEEVIKLHISSINIYAPLLMKSTDILLVLSFYWIV